MLKGLFPALRPRHRSISKPNHPGLLLCFIKQDIVGCDVAMKDAASVHGGYRRRRCGCRFEKALDGHRASTQITENMAARISQSQSQLVKTVRDSFWQCGPRLVEPVGDRQLRMQQGRLA